jgi:hypothetical protein
LYNVSRFDGPVSSTNERYRFRHSYDEIIHGGFRKVAHRDSIRRKNPSSSAKRSGPCSDVASDVPARLTFSDAHHYLSMARHNYREHMRDGSSPNVKLKKYLYITRPLLCCRFIGRDPTAGPPPMHFV